MSHLTEEELAALQSSMLGRGAPYIIQGVSFTQFSVARYSGGCKYNGRKYIYIPATDEFIRDDVIKWVTKYRKAQGKKEKEEIAKMQQVLL